VFYGEYLNADGQGTVDVLDGAGDDIGTLDINEVEVWGLGVVQEVDAAAMSVWIKYRNQSVDVSNNTTDVGVEDFDYVGIGGLINY
jgi:hypothetical protein